MASIGHIAVGMAAARLYHDGRDPGWRSMAAWSALSMLPDADVVGFALGVRYADPFGHRGATHSLTAALAGGIATGLAARAIERPARRTAIAATAVLASHGLLDTLTDGGLGAALLWPFDLTRFFAPWRPIPVAPTGLEFVTGGGFGVALVEVIYFLPLFLLALIPRQGRWKAGPSRAVAAATAMVLAVGCCMVVAQVALRRSALVSRLEAPVLQELALKEQRHRVRHP